jgi:hypothetical protein
MKTIITFATLSFVFCFIFNNVNAQVVKSIIYYDVDLPVNVPCLGENQNLVGSGTVTIFDLGHNRYVNKWEGVVYDLDGNEYTFTNTEHYEWSDDLGCPLDGGNTLQLRRGHKLVALIHANYNYKEEDGVPYLQSGGSWVECK